MPKFAANLTMLFTEVDFLDRFEAAAKVGFKGVECLFPYPYPARRRDGDQLREGAQLSPAQLPCRPST
jgi:hydroxypyruvate isomerase